MESRSVKGAGFAESRVKWAESMGAKITESFVDSIKSLGARNVESHAESCGVKSVDCVESLKHTRFAESVESRKMKKARSVESIFMRFSKSHALLLPLALSSTLFAVSPATTDIDNDCSGGVCVINDDRAQGLSVEKSYSSITINSTINGATGDDGKQDDAIKIGEGINTAITIGTLTINGALITAREHSAIYLVNGNNASVTINHLVNNGLIEGGIVLGASTTSMAVIGRLDNYGTITGGILAGKTGGQSGGYARVNEINNYGLIYPSTAADASGNNYLHLNGGSGTDYVNVVINDWHIHITQDSNTFNTFATKDSNDTSHISTGDSTSNSSGGTSNSKFVFLKNANSKILVSIGGDFQLDTDYNLNQIICGKGTCSGYTIKYADNSDIGDLYTHLSSTNPIYTISRGNGAGTFRVSIETSNAIGNDFYKSNIAGMNNLTMRYKRFIFGKSALVRDNRVASRENLLYFSRDLWQVSNAPFAESMGAESVGIAAYMNNRALSMSDEIALGGRFYYDNEALKNARRQSSYFLKSRGDSGENAESVESTKSAGNSTSGENATQSTSAESHAPSVESPSVDSTNIAESTSATYTSAESMESTSATSPTPKTTSGGAMDYFFAPFVSYSDFSKSDGIGLSGLDYGFITGLNGDLGENHTLGFHLGFAYGNMNGTSGVVERDITTMSLMLGLHYRLGLAYGMYVKAMIDGFYFLNDVESKMLALSYTQKPNNIGFGGSIYYGKDFDFGRGGTLGVEGGFVYQGFMGAAMEFDEIYDSQMLNLYYVDVWSNYTKTFDNGVVADAMLGAKVLLNTASVDMRLWDSAYSVNIGLDRWQAYFGAGVGYYINKDIMLNFNYLGEIGDTSMTHSGFFNVKVWW